MNAPLSLDETIAPDPDMEANVGPKSRTAPSLSREKATRFRRMMVGRKGLRVMVVDNDQESADEIAWRLHCWGHDTVATYDGQSALRRAAVLHPQLVLINLEMPHFDGCQVTRQLRLDFRNDDCFIIGVTWRTDQKRRDESIRAGVDLLLVKPVRMMVVETLLMLECDRANRLQAERRANPQESHKRNATDLAPGAIV